MPVQKFKICLIIILVFLIKANLYADKVKISIIDTTKNYENVSKVFRSIIEKNLSQKNFHLVDTKNNELGKIIYHPDLTEKEKIIKIGLVTDVDIIIIVNISKTERDTIANIRIFEIKNERIIDAQTTNITKLNKKEIDKISESISNNVVTEMTNYENKSQHHLFSKFVYATPMGYFKEVANYGMGVNFSFVFEDYLYSRSYFSADVSYIRFGGKDIESHHSYLIPLTLSIGYNFNYRKFYTIPLISIGGVYNKVYYNANRESEKIKNNSNVNPLIRAGFVLAYKHNYSYINIGAEYNKTILTDKNKAFLTYNIGLSIQF